MNAALYKAFKHIIYRDIDHTYTCLKTGNQLTSMTTYKKRWEPEFDDTWADRKAPIYGTDAKRVKEFWKHESWLATEKGSLLHAFLEALFQRKIIYPEIPKYLNQADVQKLFKMATDYFKTVEEAVVALEIVMGNEIVGGTADKLLEGQNGLILRDYKGLSIDTPIATIDGFKPMGEIKEGDLVFDGNGIVTEVLHVSTVHYNPCYRITFDTNDTIVADHEHQWILNMRVSNSYPAYKEVVQTTEEMYQWYLANGKNDKLRIKNHNGLHTNEKELPIDPYVLGLWLGDGKHTDGTITGRYDHIWEEVKRRGYGISACLGNNPDKTCCKTVYGLRTQLRKLGLLGNKHIPDLYMRASQEQRLDLLRGFMDADGYYNPKRKRCVMITTKEWQARDVAKLIATLGDKPTIIPAKTTGFGKTDIPCWHVCFSPVKNPFLMRNGSCIISSARKNFKNKHRYITKIEKIPIVPTKCISVKSQSESYLAGHNLIKTHNTGKIKSSRDMLKAPYEYLQAGTIGSWTLQLNGYRDMLESNGFPVEKMEIVYFNEDNDSAKIYPIERINFIW